MKVRQRKVCHTCRAKKLGCDGRQPACSQCVLTGHMCGGYEYDLIFVHHNSTATKKPYSARSKKGGVICSQDRTGWPLTFGIPPNLPAISLNDMTLFIIQNYTPACEIPLLFSDPATPRPRSRVCGVWAETLPTLVTMGKHETLLSCAVQTLGLAILSKGPSYGFSQFECFKTYSRALRYLQHQLSRVGSCFDEKLAAAIMCLTLAELMLPTSDFAWSAHVKGVEGLIRVSGPELFSKGIPHILFAGFRPLLLFDAFQSRRSTFLTLDEWTSIPFKASPPSPMQSLLSQAAAIPPVLERVDLLAKFPETVETTKIIGKAVDELLNILELLRGWKHSLSRELAEPLYWVAAGPESPSNLVIRGYQRSDRQYGHRLWFPSLMVASCMTHYWAFKIVCLLELNKLLSLYPTTTLYALESRENEHSNPWPYHPFNDQAGLPSQARALDLAINICQSMEYLMQDEMKLYGPASTFFPLKTAIECFKVGPLEGKDHLTRVIVADKENPWFNTKLYFYYGLLTSCQAQLLLWVNEADSPKPTIVAIVQA
ncbi:hypothetical protein FQN57_007074 [Myotisia sp. PD_48]|nr:hypothetical protein FQN57_007074 [Myotisia sp. PD_48]